MAVSGSRLALRVRICALAVTLVSVAWLGGAGGAIEGAHGAGTAATALGAEALDGRKAGALQLRLPATADEPVAICISSACIELGLVGARRVSAQPEHLEARYPGGGPDGGQVVWRAHVGGGVEDVVELRSRGLGTRVAYKVQLRGRAASLRLVGGVVEVLDALGTPRLRANAAVVVDARGVRRDGELALDGCRYDGDPRPPWGRVPATDPSSSCRLEVRFDDDGLAYPLSVDPTWSLTTSMSVSRSHHTATLLTDAPGRVLVTGGCSEGMGLASAELFDPPSKTWAMTGGMSQSRVWHTASRLGDGSVLVAGGYAADCETADSRSVEKYDLADGVFVAVGDLRTERVKHAATLLADGRVLVTGSPGKAAAEIFDPTSASWTLVDSMGATRERHVAVRLADGRVLVAAGICGGTPCTTTESFDPATGTWSWLPGSLATPRFDAVATAIAGDDVLVAGGCDGDGAATNAVDRFSQGGWTAAAPMWQPRCGHAGAAFGSGLLVSGGMGAAFALASAERFEPTNSSWVAVPPLTKARSGHAFTVLASGNVALVTGPDAAAELYIDGVPGLGPCAVDEECLTGICADGVCCSTPCDGPCSACAAAFKAGGPDGECGFAAAGLDPRGSCLPDEGYPGNCAGDGLCDGHGTCRAQSPVGTGCAASCDAGVAVGGACDANGICQLEDTACAPFGCGEHACLDECNGPEDCADGAFCTTERLCQLDLELGDDCLFDDMCASAHCTDERCCLVEACGQFRCDATGHCPSRCASTADCAAGLVCASDGTCRSPPGLLPGSGGCSCELVRAGKSPDGVAWWVAAVAAALGCLHRRKKFAVGLLLASLELCRPATAGAQPADHALAEAKRLFREGNELRRAGDCLGAVERYALSRLLVPGIANTWNAAHCLEHLGRIAEAYDLAREVAERFGDDLADAERAELRQALARLAARLAFVLVDAKDPTTLVIDGRSPVQFPRPQPIGIMPGKHILRLEGRGTSDEHVVVLTAGQVLVLAAAGGASEHVPGPPSAPPPENEDARTVADAAGEASPTHVSARVALAVAPRLGGDAEGSCPARCRSREIGLGVVAEARLSHEVAPPFSVALGVGYLGMRRELVRTISTRFNDGASDLPRSATYTLDDTFALDGFFAVAGVEIDVELHSGVSWRASLLAGPLVERVRDEVRAAVAMGSETRFATLLGAERPTTATAGVVFPSAGFELRAGGFRGELGLGLGLVIAADVRSRAGDLVVIGACDHTLPASIDCVPGTSATSAERLHETFIAWLPELRLGGAF